MTRDQLLEQQRIDLCTLVTELNKSGDFREAMLIMAVVETNAAAADQLSELGLEAEPFPRC